MFQRGHDKRRKTEECVLLNLSGRSVAGPGSVQIAAELHVTESCCVRVCVRARMTVCVCARTRVELQYLCGRLKINDLDVCACVCEGDGGGPAVWRGFSALKHLSIITYITRTNSQKWDRMRASVRLKKCPREATNSSFIQNSRIVQREVRSSVKNQRIAPYTTYMSPHTFIIQ